ncbi:phosphotransferase [Luedemannella helvata]|uniref:Aminoglycoside phosphotransferase domain-containing protein n=1 Tax=Luedemannella helvata TaxID=349315 RepID=A0ABN2KH50_9ACTN
MHTEPADLDRAELADLVRTGWGLDAGELTYAPVGFGTHHYRSGDLFINVDDTDDWVARGRSLGAAVLLKENNLGYVHAPRRRPDGGWLAGFGEGRYAASVYDLIDGRSGHFGDTLTAPDRDAALTALRRLHDATGVLPPHLLDRDDLAIAHRATLFDDSWADGPYALPARELITGNRTALEDKLATYDALVRETATDDWVITHGEPHAGNIMWTRDGDLRLIDWDTVRLAPPERDLWLLPGDDWTAYGRVPDARALELYRLRWELTDICDYADTFRRPHADNEDTQASWRFFAGHLST